MQISFILRRSWLQYTVHGSLGLASGFGDLVAALRPPRPLNIALLPPVPQNVTTRHHMHQNVGIRPHSSSECQNASIAEVRHIEY